MAWNDVFSMNAAARWRGGSRRSLAGLGIHQVQLILHTVFERVGERRVTGRDFGENAAAPATSKDVARIATNRSSEATLVSYLAAVRHLI